MVGISMKHKEVKPSIGDVPEQQSTILMASDQPTIRQNSHASYMRIEKETCGESVLHVEPSMTRMQLVVRTSHILTVESPQLAMRSPLPLPRCSRTIFQTGPECPTKVLIATQSPSSSRRLHRLMVVSIEAPAKVWSESSIRLEHTPCPKND